MRVPSFSPWLVAYGLLRPAAAAADAARDGTRAISPSPHSHPFALLQLVASTFGYSQVSPLSEGRELSDKTRFGNMDP